MKGVLQQKASQRGKRKRKGTLKARAGKEGRGHLSGGEGGGESNEKIVTFSRRACCMEKHCRIAAETLH